VSICLGAVRRPGEAAYYFPLEEADVRFISMVNILGPEHAMELEIREMFDSPRGHA
jgi:hypothetical protein